MRFLATFDTTLPQHANITAEEVRLFLVSGGFSDVVQIQDDEPLDDVPSVSTADASEAFEGRRS